MHARRHTRTDRQTDRQARTQVRTNTHSHTRRHTEDRQTYTHTHIHTHIHTHVHMQAHQGGGGSREKKKKTHEIMHVQITEVVQRGRNTAASAFSDSMQTAALVDRSRGGLRYILSISVRSSSRTSVPLLFPLGICPSRIC